MGKDMEESSAITIACLNCSEERSTVKTKSTPLQNYSTHIKNKESRRPVMCDDHVCGKKLR